MQKVTRYDQESQIYVDVQSKQTTIELVKHLRKTFGRLALLIGINRRLPGTAYYHNTSCNINLPLHQKNYQQNEDRLQLLLRGLDETVCWASNQVYH